MITRRLIAASALLTPLIATPATAGRNVQDPDANKHLVRRFFEEVWSTGDVARRDDFLSPDYQGHLAGAPGPIDRNGWTAWFEGFRLAFPDARFTVEDLIADGDRVAARLTMTGTHLGPLNGMPPTGRSVVVGGMSIERVVDGRIVEGWNQNDALGLLTQIGALPSA